MPVIHNFTELQKGLIHPKYANRFKLSSIDGDTSSHIANSLRIQMVSLQYEKNEHGNFINMIIEDDVGHNASRALDSLPEKFNMTVEQSSAHDDVLNMITFENVSVIREHYALDYASSKANRFDLTLSCETITRIYL